MQNQLNRRQFLDLTVASAAGLAVAAAVRAQDSNAPSDRVIIGVMGLSRGGAVAETFINQPGVEIRYVCDVDSRRMEQCAGAIEKAGVARPKAVADFRRILEDKEVDALICAAPNHWHAPATILACAADKHVYVEKPCSHNPHEGELMVEAARTNKRVVQVGTQRRSSPVVREAIDLLHAGEIGRVYSSRAVYANGRGSIGLGKPADPPEQLDYDLWQGPAPRTPYVDNRVHYNWHWFWHWGNGELGNNGVHTLDICRWGLGVDYPIHVTSAGGRYCFDDDQETPDTHTVAFEFEDEKLITWQGHSCNRLGEQDFVDFYGERGALTVSGDGGYTLYDQEAKVVRTVKGILGDPEHAANFLDAIRNDDASRLHCGVEDANKSTLMCHLGNIAHRTRRSLTCDATNGHIVDDDDAMKLWRREYEPGWEPSA